MGNNFEAYRFEWERILRQRRALLMLIPKGNKDKRLLKNWRPISLLNVDYKIMAKALATRIQKVISSVINSDQVGYIKGRYIGDNIRTILDILEITKKEVDPGLLVMIDFEKEFDTVSWQFLYKTLDYFNFGPIFKHYINLLCTSPECCVTNNGFHTEFFSNPKRNKTGMSNIGIFIYLVCRGISNSNSARTKHKGIENRQ